MFELGWECSGVGLMDVGGVLGDPVGGSGGPRSVLDGLVGFWNGFHGVCASSGCLWTDLEWFWNGFLGVWRVYVAYPGSGSGFSPPLR